jgi:hypothetical protein
MNLLIFHDENKKEQKNSLIFDPKKYDDYPGVYYDGYGCDYGYDQDSLIFDPKKYYDNGRDHDRKVFFNLAFGSDIVIRVFNNKNGDVFIKPNWDHPIHIISNIRQTNPQDLFELISVYLIMGA